MYKKPALDVWTRHAYSAVLLTSSPKRGTMVHSRRLMQINSFPGILIRAWIRTTFGMAARGSSGTRSRPVAGQTVAVTRRWEARRACVRA
jgi:hypothetical protein